MPLAEPAHPGVGMQASDAAGSVVVEPIGAESRDLGPATLAAVDEPVGIEPPVSRRHDRPAHSELRAELSLGG
jgi:hypothetical protein